MSLRISTQRT